MDGNRPEGSGHPLPASEESRHGEIPEGAVAEKGFGDDSAERVQPAPEAASPDGEPYRYDDNGRAEDVETAAGAGREDIETGERFVREDVETGERAAREDVETGEGGGRESLGPGMPA